uniref:DUF7653 domain-containing protein n=1 Tax=Saccharum hybrid cultivar R570 TaxID=131158 RepID=A0A059Q0Y4_9POAL|nr:hypothetical protein SHCRBa_011_I19_F_120 [Saccharum hybrid cultivar R570]
MRRFFPFRSFTSSAENGKAARANDTMNENKVDEAGTSGAHRSPGARSFRSRSRHGASRNEESSHPQLRRSFSLTSSAMDHSLDEQMMSYSRDILCSKSNDSDTPGHFGKVELSAGATHVHQEDTAVEENTWPAKLTNFVNKNEVLDLYIDGEQEVARLNEKQNQKFIIIENPSNIDTDDIWHSHHAYEGTKGAFKVASVCHEGGHDARFLEASSEYLSNFEECRSQSITTVDDIYEDLQDVQPPSPFFYSTSTDPISSATSRYFTADIHCHDQSHGVHDFNLEQDTDEKLLQRAKEVDACLMVPLVENSKLNALRDKRSNSTEIWQFIEGLIEDRKKLAAEVSSQIKARLTERFAAKEQYKRSKLELETRTRRLEKEKIDLQSNLERELDRRSNDCSVKLERFQSEEQRLQERVRELAEQNVSFQREITLLESYKVDATSRIKSLELQNKHLNNELQEVKDDRDNLHSSSVELQDNLNIAIVERDMIRESLKDKEEDKKVLHKIIARLQRTSNEQEKTITSLRKGFGAEIEKRAAGNSDIINRMQMELLRLTGVEQNLRREIQSCTIEMESLRQENVAIFNRLQRSEDGANFSTVRLDQELQARVESLQTQGLSLLDDSSQLCAKLLELIKSKKSENSSDVDALVAIEYTLKYQSMIGGIENVKQSLRMIKSLLTEKQNEEETEQRAEGYLSGQEKLSRDDIEIKLREEAMTSRVLKEKLLSKELDIEHLQSDLAASVRVQEVLQSEIQRVQDELCCLTHKYKHLEVQGLKKDEIINQVEAGLPGICKGTDCSSLHAQNNEKNCQWLANEVASLKQKIRALDEDLRLKESEILLREGEISILRDGSDKPFDIICSPRSMRQFGME